jgi:hypothetical protein
MEGKLASRNPQGVTFLQLPVGAWFIYECDRHEKSVAPYLKISDSSAYSAATKTTYTSPPFFPLGEAVYLEVEPGGEITWSIR